MVVAACGGSSSTLGNGGSDAGTTASCQAVQSCNGETSLEACQSSDSSGHCAQQYYKVGAQVFPCTSRPA